MKRTTKRFTSFMVLCMGMIAGLLPAQTHAQISADIQIGAGDRGLNPNTTLQVKAGDELTIEIFATEYTDAQGVEVVLEVSDISALTTVNNQGDIAAGSSTEFPVVINSAADNVLTMSAVNFGATKTYSGNAKLVASMALKLADTFSGTTISVTKVDFGGNPVNPNISFNLTLPLNNLVTSVSTSPRHNAARLSFVTKLATIDNSIKYREQGTTDWTTIQTDLQKNTSTEVIAAVKALYGTTINIQSATDAALTTALTAAGITNASTTLLTSIRTLNRALNTLKHEVDITGLTANTSYEYEIVATSILGELSPTKTGTFKTRLTPDVRPVTISNVTTSVTDKSAIITWSTNRPTSTAYQIKTPTLGTDPGTVVASQEADTTTTGTTEHTATIENLTPGTLYYYTLTNKLIGGDDLVTDGLMTTDQITISRTRVIKTKANLPPLDLVTAPRVVTTSSTATITIQANQSVLAAVHYHSPMQVGESGDELPRPRADGRYDTTDDTFYTKWVSSRFLGGEKHTIEITGLETGQTYAEPYVYNYRVVLTSAEDQTVTYSTDPRTKNKYKTYSFTIRPPSPVLPLIITNPQVQTSTFDRFSLYSIPIGISLTKQTTEPATDLASTLYLKANFDYPVVSALHIGTSTNLGTPDEIVVTPTNAGSTTQTFVISDLPAGASLSYNILYGTPDAVATSTVDIFSPGVDTGTLPDGISVFGTSNPANKPIAAKQATGSGGSFTTPTTVDTQNPLITRGPTVVSASQTTLTLAWETSEPTTGTVVYGASANNLDNQQTVGDASTNHKVILSGLTRGQTYAFQVQATDLAANGPTQSAVAFGSTLATADITAPTILSPTLNYVSDKVAEIAWSTNELSFGEFRYGTHADSLFNFRPLSESATKHGVSLGSLTANTTYYYQIAMTDVNGNGPTRGIVRSFKTAAESDTQAPTISDVVVTPLETSAIITWKTNEVANSIVKYGTDVNTLTENTSDIDIVTDHRIIVSNLTAGTQYGYVVQAFDRTGNGPAETTATTFTTQAAGAASGPVAPADLVARAGNKVIQLTWAAPAADATSLLLERAEGEGDFAPVANLDLITSFNDQNVQNGTAYRYRISAQGIQGAGTASAATTAVTPSTISGPSAPTLFIIQGKQTTPTIAINNSTPIAADDEITYTLLISTASDFSDVVALETVDSGAGRGSSDPAEITVFNVGNTLDDGVTYHYQVTANDGFSDSPALTGSFTVKASAPAYPGELNGDKSVGFPDFIQFVSSFNKGSTDPAYLPDADLNGDGNVGFPDFLQFVSVFNDKYLQGSGSGKPVVTVEFAQDNQAQFNLLGRFVQNKAERELAIDVQLKDVHNMQGYGFKLSYDPTILEFVNATDDGNTFLKAGDRTADLFAVLDHNQETGELYIASAITKGNAVSGAGTLGTITFRLLDPNPQNADINIAQGILFNPKFDGFIATNLGDRFTLIPTEYALEQNFPNPFNPETTLRYAIPQAGDVSLIIYNILGQEVIRLVNAQQLPGFYAINWNGKDALGRGVASGVYLYRIQAGAFNQTHKMLLLK